MNSQEYIEVSVKITPFSEENAEILTAEISELPFESFSSEEPYLNCYIQKELYDPQALKVIMGGIEDYGFKAGYTARLMPAVNWNAVWESQFPPIVVDGKCTIKASFHEDLKKTRYNRVRSLMSVVISSSTFSFENIARNIITKFNAPTKFQWVNAYL